MTGKNQKTCHTVLQIGFQITQRS